MRHLATTKQIEARVHNWTKAQMKCGHAICYRAKQQDKRLSVKQLELLNKALNIFEEILQEWDYV